MSSFWIFRSGPTRFLGLNGATLCPRENQETDGFNEPLVIICSPGRNQLGFMEQFDGLRFAVAWIVHADDDAERRAELARVKHAVHQQFPDFFLTR